MPQQSPDQLMQPVLISSEATLKLIMYYQGTSSYLPTLEDLVATMEA